MYNDKSLEDPVIGYVMRTGEPPRYSRDDDDDEVFASNDYLEED